MKNDGKNIISWKRRELPLLVLYALVFYAVIIRRSLQLSHDYSLNLYGLRPGWIAHRLNDVSDSQWRNFRGNLPVLTVVFGIFAFVANSSRVLLHLKTRGMSSVWLLISLAYLLYLHGACTVFVLSIASLNFLLVKIFVKTKCFSLMLWTFSIFFLICNRVYEGYSFSIFGQRWIFLDNFRGVFRWQICFNFGNFVIVIGHTLSGALCMALAIGNYINSIILRMVSFGYDYCWACQGSGSDQKRHAEYCRICKSGKTCYQILQERSVPSDKYSFGTYLCYLIYAPLYISGPIISFNAFASQLERPQKNYALKDIVLYGLRWILNLLLMELMTHFFYYNAFAISGLWKQLSAMDVFIIGYGVLNFMWLKFLLIWRYFRLWSLICGVEAPENMPKCINNCYNLESFWKSWHASYNKWLVRYIYIPLGGSQKKLLNIWVIFTFVALWHDLEWKLLSWAWLTCLFYVPELVLKSVANSFQVKNALGELFFREVGATTGAVTITCLMVANLVGFVIGPTGISWLIARFLQKEGWPILVGMFFTFYVGTKLMFHIQDAKRLGQ